MREYVLRQLRRARRITGFFAAVLPAWWYVQRFGPAAPNAASGACCLQTWSRSTLRALGVQVTRIGAAPPSQGLLVSNHLGYLDIPVHSSIVPAAFVSKAEVARWPIIGALAGFSGSIFIQREKRGNSLAANARISAALQTGVPVLLFPEGTTTDGHEVLQFHSSMLEAAVDSEVTVTPCAIRYDVSEGDSATEVCWWGDMTLLRHVMNLIGKREIRATVMFGEPIPPMGNRKELAKVARQRVLELHYALGMSHSPSLVTSGRE
jgi:1-acyl-sn-glycerol-3-phosphate acyltransferase